MLAICQDHLHSQDWLVCITWSLKTWKKPWEAKTAIRPIKRCLFFETGPPCITQASLELTGILLPQLSSAEITDMNSYERRLISFIPF